MNKKTDFETACELIKEGFNDNREIVGKASQDIQKISEKHGIFADIYQTKENALISLGFEDEDINNKKIDDIIAYGEELYEKSGEIVSIDIIGSPDTKFDVTKKIESTGEIIIKFMPTPYSETYDVLRHLQDLLKRRVKFDKDDLEALAMVPMMGPPEDRRNLRIECLKIWKEVINKGLIK